MPPAPTTPQPSVTGALTPDGRTRYANGERRRAQIVNDATEVFAQQGFHNLSLRQIAEAVGVSHSLLRHHFGTKDALLQAVLTHREENEADWRAELFAERGLLEALPIVMEHNTTIPGLIQLDTVLRAEAINPDHPAHDYVVGLARRFRAQLRTDLEAEQRAGRVREDVDLDVAALHIAALIEGLQSEWLLDRSVDVAGAVAAFTEQLRAD